MATAAEIEHLFETKTLIAALVELKPAPSFLKDRFFAGVELTDADTIQADIMKGSQRIAPHCSRFKRSIMVPREVFKTCEFKAPYVKLSSDLKAADLMRRGFGESSFARQSAEERAAALTARDLDKRITRRENLLCAQTLFEGKWTAIDGDDHETLIEVSYGPLNVTAISPLWSDPASLPLDDIIEMYRLVNSGGAADSDTVVMGRSAADAFRGNASVQKAYDLRNIFEGQLKPEYRGGGVTYLGTFYGCEIFVDEGMYVDENGATQTFVDPKKILVGSSQGGGRMGYCGVEQLEPDAGMQVYALSRVPLIFDDLPRETRMVRLSSRPCPIPLDLASWTVATVLA